MKHAIRRRVHDMAVASLLAAATSCALLAVSPGQLSSPSERYRAALARWHAALDPQKPGMLVLSFTPYFGHPAFKELNDAVADLSSFGANMIPFQVEEVRSDVRDLKKAVGATASPSELDHTAVRSQNPVGRAAYRLDLDVQLMFLLGGIQLGLGMSDSRTPSTMPGGTSPEIAGLLTLAENFLEEWDSGAFLRADAKLRDVRKANPEMPGAATADFRKTFPYRRYGLYALPFLIAEIRRTNSAECFNAFLIITFHRDLYVAHYENPRKIYPTPEEKMDFIGTWWRDNRAKFERLGSLPGGIQSAIESHQAR